MKKRNGRPLSGAQERVLKLIRDCAKVSKRKGETLKIDNLFVYEKTLTILISMYFIRCEYLETTEVYTITDLGKKYLQERKEASTAYEKVDFINPTRYTGEIGKDWHSIPAYAVIFADGSKGTVRSRKTPEQLLASGRITYLKSVLTELSS